MPQPVQAKGTGDGGHEGDEVDGNKRAKARASSKEKRKAAKKKKKKKTSAPACQVRSDMIRIPLARRSRARTANTQRV